MLNPSTADASKDDPTIRKCVQFANAWGLGRILVTNLFAARSTDPSKLPFFADPVGPSNDEHILWAARSSALTVLAWGNGGALLSRNQTVRGLLEKCAVYRLGHPTQSGAPRHPLYLPIKTPLVSAV